DTELVPKGLLIADVNGDDAKDIIVTNSMSYTVSAFLGDDTGQFGIPLSVPVGHLPVQARFGTAMVGEMEVEAVIVNNIGDETWSILVFTGMDTVQVISEPAIPEKILEIKYYDEYNINVNNVFGDTNHDREQGYILIEANEIFNVAQHGIISDAGELDPNAQPGVAASFKKADSEHLVPGISIVNNLIVNAGNAGIYFSGSPYADLMGTAVPFGRILNNTIYNADVGIQVDENASPTILNNIVANSDIGISIDSTSQTTIAGAMVYQENTTDYVGISDIDQYSLFLDKDDPLFVDPEHYNFYLAAGSPAIDNAMDNIQDRPELTTVNGDLGISPSPILAPNYDLYGQLRTDDPNMNTDPGSGLDPFTDRGAIDRVDFTPPTATLIDPLDNDPLGVDRDPEENEVFIAYERVFSFAIKLSDSSGAGIDDNTVMSHAVKIYQDGSSTPLIVGSDYYFSYDTQENIIQLYPASGTWPAGSTYEIVLNNSEDGIADIAGNPVTPSQNRFDGLTAFNIAIASFDFGDAPDPTYPSLLGDTQDPNEGGARHVQMGDYYLGFHVTGENDANLVYDEETGELIMNANGDAGDDGVVFSDSALLIGQENVEAIVTASRNGGYLNAWIDFNGDGDWDDPGEQIATNLELHQGANSVLFDVSDTLSTMITYARFRYSSQPDLTPIGEAPDGEVEDYQVHIVGALLDYGDAPDSYGTTFLNNGANHEIHGSIYLGNNVDNEIDGQPHPHAVGDDQIGILAGNTVINDEDGVEFTDYFIPGQSASINVTAHGAGYLNAWIDFNADGVWDESEQVADNVFLADEIKALIVNVPAEAENCMTFARFRFSSDLDLAPTGTASDGEVEDYAITISSQPRDFGDAPRSYLTQENSSAANALIVLPGKNNDILLIANTAGTKYDGVKFSFVNEITYGDTARVTFNQVTQSYLIDVDPNATTAQSVIDAINEEGTFLAILDVTNDMNNNGTGLIGTTTGIVTTTSGGYDGEGEDAVSHALGSGLMLGTLVDAELDGVASEDALADDQSNLDDEEGFSNITQIALIAGEQASLTVSATLHEVGGVAQTAYLNGWIDFNQDGVFDENEQVIAGMAVTENWTDHLVDITIPIDALEGDTYARFRISSEQNLDWFGPADDGEVEDYLVNIIKGDATIKGHAFQDLNFNTVWDANEEGRVGITVYIDIDNDGQLDVDSFGIPTEPYTVTMDDNLATLDIDETGYYEFKGLFGQPNPYTIRELTPTNSLQSYPNELVVLPDSSYGNSDGSYTIFLEDG
ncbi:MAG: GEVED domain-containing protein, partial [Planctomycetia bacterium]